MQPIAASGMPGTMMVEGRTRNGNGTSEPISTSGFQAASVRGAQPLGQEHHRRNADAAADREHARRARGAARSPGRSGPSTLNAAGGSARDSARVPGPTTL